MKEWYEPYDYMIGDIEELRSRALALATFFTESSERFAMTIGREIYNSSSEKDIKDMLETLVKKVLSDETNDDNAWYDLYQSFFGVSPQWFGSKHIPEDGEIKDITKESLRDKKRIKTEVPKGFLA